MLGTLRSAVQMERCLDLMVQHVGSMFSFPSQAQRAAVHEGCLLRSVFSVCQQAACPTVNSCRLSNTYPERFLTGTLLLLSPVQGTDGGGGEALLPPNLCCGRVSQWLAVQLKLSAINPQSAMEHSHGVCLIIV